MDKVLTVLVAIRTILPKVDGFMIAPRGVLR